MAEVATHLVSLLKEIHVITQRGIVTVTEIEIEIAVATTATATIATITITTEAHSIDLDPFPRERDTMYATRAAKISQSLIPIKEEEGEEDGVVIGNMNAIMIDEEKRSK